MKGDSLSLDRNFCWKLFNTVYTRLFPLCITITLLLTDFILSWHVFQPPYQSHNSTEMVLLHVLNDLLITSDFYQISVLSLHDLSAAFNTTNHDIMSHLSNVFGIQETALLFLKSYLAERVKVIFVHGYDSDPSRLWYGVPWGSVLVPVLLSCTHSPYQNNILSLCFVSYVDDIILYTSVDHSDINSPVIAMQSCATRQQASAQ